MSEEQKVFDQGVRFRKGILVATFCGVMSSCFSYGLDAGDRSSRSPLNNLERRSCGKGCRCWSSCCWAVSRRTSSGVRLNVKNKTGYQYLSGTVRITRPAVTRRRSSRLPSTPPAKKSSNTFPVGADLSGCPCCRTIFLPLAGTTWYFQFFFYTMGETQMGKYKFSSWTLHMASIIIFSTLWGIASASGKGPAGGRLPWSRWGGNAGRLHDHCRIRQLPGNFAGRADGTAGCHADSRRAQAGSEFGYVPAMPWSINSWRLALTPGYGARPLQRELETRVVTPLSRFLLKDFSGLHGVEIELDTDSEGGLIIR